MVLSGTARLLSAIDLRYQSRKTKKRLWANASPPLCNKFLDVCGIRLSLDERWQCDSMHYGRGRFFIAGT